MVSVVVFGFSGMRCQPLRRALCVSTRGPFRFSAFKCSEISFTSVFNTCLVISYHLDLFDM
ncbi:hypothetical protein FLL97_19320 [Vibrio cholerae]|nr:hypothetical protein FLL97_19320 [Vibrio cholerae]TQP80224.1 hypothetical protein FLL74_20115 [Vibrio cholerae]